MARQLCAGLVAVSLAFEGLAQTQCAGRAQTNCAGDCQWNANGAIANGGACGEKCFKPDVAYTGDMPNQGVTTVATQEACKQRCEGVANCRYFSYYPSTQSCHLQDATAARQSQPGAVAGDVNSVCPTSTQESDGTSNGADGVSNGADGSSGFSSSDGSAGFGATESMPSNVGTVMQSGSVDTSNSFSDLSLQPSPESSPITSSGAGASSLFGTAAFAGATILVAFGVMALRRRESSPAVLNVAE